MMKKKATKALLFGLGAATLVVVREALKNKGQNHSSAGSNSNNTDNSYSSYGSYGSSFSTPSSSTDTLIDYLKRDQEASARQARENDIYWQKQQAEQRYWEQVENNRIDTENYYRQLENDAIDRENHYRQQEADAAYYNNQNY